MSPLRAALAGARRARRAWGQTWEGWWMRLHEALARRWLPPEVRRDTSVDERELDALRRQHDDLARRRAAVERRLAAVDLEVRVRGGEIGSAR